MLHWQATTFIVFYTGTLIKNTADFVDKIMETDEDICSQWSNPDLVLAVMEAVKQTGYTLINTLVDS